jgi:hypothetical protein
MHSSDEGCIARPFQLAAHAYVRIGDRGAIVLDARSDSYIGLNLDQVCALSILVDGWPRHSDSNAIDPAQAWSFVRSLVNRGVVVPRCQGGKPYTSCCVPLAEDELVPWDEASPAGIRIHHIVRFVLSVVVVAMRLQFFSFHALVDKERQRAKRAAVRPWNMALAKSLLSVFLNLRVFCYRRRGRCLFDSLVLLEFLMRYGIRPTWVVGVRDIPFAAHSWVQYERAVLNGTPAYVRAYSSILAI